VTSPAFGKGPSWRSLLSRWRVTRLEPRVGHPPRLRHQAMLARALRRAGFPRFMESAREARAGVTVVVNDPHRDAGTRGALEAIVRTCRRGGPSPALSLLVACGSHSFDPAARRRHEEVILGPLRSCFVAVAWHDARNSALLASVGPFLLHRLVARARFAVGIGSLEPHYFAGCTGAHKTLTIGVMGLAGIEANHRGALSVRASPLVLDGNPVFEGVRGALRALERRGTRLFALDVVRAGGRTIGAFAGKPVPALLAGMPLVRRCFARALPGAADLVVARVRPPLSGTLYQADKGVKNVEAAVRDGGVLILEAVCGEGVGIDRFLRLLERASDHATASDLIESEGYVLGDHKALRLRRLTGPRRVRLGIVSPSLDETTARTVGAALFRRRRDAVAWAGECLRGRADDVLRACVVEDAGNMVVTQRRAT
jgi:hypothetical protein